MRLLLDECIDRRLAQDLAGHEVRTVPQKDASWLAYKVYGQPNARKS